VHVVFVTKYRRKAMTDAMPTHCEEIMREVCTDFDAELREPRTPARALPPKSQLSKLVNSLKGVSARLLRKEYNTHVRRYLWGGHL
jgi:putative transposase